MLQEMLAASGGGGGGSQPLLNVPFVTGVLMGSSQLPSDVPAGVVRVLAFQCENYNSVELTNLNGSYNIQLYDGDTSAANFIDIIGSSTTKTLDISSYDVIYANAYPQSSSNGPNLKVTFKS